MSGRLACDVFEAVLIHAPRWYAGELCIIDEVRNATFSKFVFVAPPRAAHYLQLERLRLVSTFRIPIKRHWV